MPSTPPAREREVLSPTRLNQLARELIEAGLGLVWVEGELSNLARPASGHLYFTLKDAGAQVRCAMFRPRSSLLGFRPADGQRVLARGRVSLYEARGDFQLLVEHLEEAGEGALRRAYERLKAKLAAEGLFDVARKRPLPRWPRHLALLSSPSGAAVHDVLTVLARRFPLLPVELVPVPVQGSEAPPRLVAALAAVARAGRHDVVLLTRGGGSLEDLAAFNDEALARAIAAMPVPVVSAIGHEIDVTLADLAADLRAPTPSAAAELLVPDRAELLSALDRLQARLGAALDRARAGRAQRLDLALARLDAARPATRLAVARQRLLRVPAALGRAVATAVATRRARLALLGQRLEPRRAALRTAAARDRTARLTERIARAMRDALERRRQRLALAARALETMNPFATVARGYAIVRHADGERLVRSVAGLSVGEALGIVVADGRIDAVITALRPDDGS